MPDTTARRPLAGKAGYYNAALGVAGIAIPFPLHATHARVHVSAACYVGIGGPTLLVFATGAPLLTNYGAIGAAMAEDFSRMVLSTETHLHIAPVTGTAAVSVYFY